MKDESKLHQYVQTAEATHGVEGKKKAAKKRPPHADRPPTINIVNG